MRLVAYPAVWGKSGIKSFICGQNDKGLREGLGAGSTAIGAAMTHFDPDTNWSPSSDSDKKRESVMTSSSIFAGVLHIVRVLSERP